MNYCTTPSNPYLPFLVSCHTSRARTCWTTPRQVHRNLPTCAQRQSRQSQRKLCRRSALGRNRWTWRPQDHDPECRYRTCIGTPWETIHGSNLQNQAHSIQQAMDESVPGQIWLAGYSLSARNFMWESISCLTEGCSACAARVFHTVRKYLAFVSLQSKINIPPKYYNNTVQSGPCCETWRQQKTAQRMRYKGQEGMDSALAVRVQSFAYHLLISRLWECMP